MPDDTLGPQSEAPIGWEPELAELRARLALAKEMGGADRVARQHAGGRMTVRERIDRMLDEGSFHELGGDRGQGQLHARRTHHHRLHCPPTACSAAARWTAARW
jgi:acetyl-CoA carboxylase carboxyltransferase component